MVDDVEASSVAAGSVQGRACWTAPVRTSVILALAAALAGCNASHSVNVSPQNAPGAAPGVALGPNFVNYNPYNPVAYGQTSGFYGGR